MSAHPPDDRGWFARRTPSRPVSDEQTLFVVGSRCPCLLVGKAVPSGQCRPYQLPADRLPDESSLAAIPTVLWTPPRCRRRGSRTTIARIPRTSVLLEPDHSDSRLGGSCLAQIKAESTSVLVRLSPPPSARSNQ
jgi:hypothetical protein